MQLERIVLHNFRQYHGTQSLSFAAGDEKRVTVIHGVNGAGKTGLFLALNWCLYGKGTEKVKVIDNVGQLISKEAVARAAEGDTVSATVEVFFTHDGRKYYVKRSTSGIKIGDGVRPQDQDDVIMHVTSPDGLSQSVVDPYARINQIMPPNVRTYFLFDGEKIDNFSKPSASQEVREAIYLVLRLEVLKRAKAHLEAVAKEYRSELKSSSSQELSHLAELDERTTNERDQLKVDVEGFGRQIESATLRIRDVDDQLRNLEASRDLQDERERIEEQLHEWSKELDEKVNTTVAKQVTDGYFVAFEPALQRALEILDTKRERGELPGGIGQRFVQDLLDRGTCICGRPVTEGTDERRHLEHLVDSGVSEDLATGAISVYAKLANISGRIEGRIGNVTVGMNRRVELLAAIDEARKKLFDLKTRLEGFPVEQIRDLENKRTEFGNDCEQLKIKQGIAARDIESLEKKLEQIRDERKKALKKEARERTISTKLELAEAAATALGEIWDRFADAMRVEIEAKTREIFGMLAWKGGHFTDVRLGSDYHLDVLDRWGKAAKAELSAGERQVLSLSFIAAMSRIGDTDAPLVMDTPFGRLSQNHRNTITKHLPELARQLVLLVTDEELRGEALENIRPRIGAEYRLVFDKDASRTTIERLHA